MDWKEGLHADVTPEFVSDLAPRVGEQLRVRLRAPISAPLASIVLRAIISGYPQHVTMKVSERDARFAWWEAEVPIPHREMIHWHFILHSEKEGDFFFNRAGIKRFSGSEDGDWTIIPEFKSPGWLPGAVFYQIFPDRFHNADPTLGRITGEYQFDGGSPKAMAWDQKPLEFAEGRCLDFYNGDLLGIEKKLPYLAELGVTALYLTPVFAARTTHRYDCTDYFAVDDGLGGNEALASLSEKAHEKGIKLILDVSINHTGSDHVWHRQALANPKGEEASYYYARADGGFEGWLGVPTLPQLDYGNDQLRQVIWQGEDALVKHWLRPPYRIDGWRFDVGNMTGRRQEDQYGPEIWRAVRKAIKDENPNAYIVGEHWEDAISYQLGDQWDASMNYFGCGTPLRRWAGEQVRPESGEPYYPPRQGREFTGYELEEMLRQALDRYPNQVLPLQMNLIDSHDIHRLHHSPAFDWDIYRGIVMLQFLLPGAPCIWYGDEVGLAGHAESVEGCRYPMEWREDHWQADFRDLYRTLTRLKRERQVLATGSHRFLAAGEHWLAFARFTKAEALIGVINRNPQPSKVEIPLLALPAARQAVDLFAKREWPVLGDSLSVPLGAKESALIDLLP